MNCACSTPCGRCASCRRRSTNPSPMRPASPAPTVPSTTCSTPARASGQDFAHVMLSICRSWGVPARYVSGYLFTDRKHGDRSDPDAHSRLGGGLPAEPALGGLRPDQQHHGLRAPRGLRGRSRLFRRAALARRLQGRGGERAGGRRHRAPRRAAVAEPEFLRTSQTAPAPASAAARTAASPTNTSASSSNSSSNRSPGGLRERRARCPSVLAARGRARGTDGPTAASFTWPSVTGALRKPLTAGSAPGESGVSIVRARFRAGVELAGNAAGAPDLLPGVPAGALRVPHRRALACARGAGGIPGPVSGPARIARPKSDGAVDMVMVAIQPRAGSRWRAAEDLSLDARVASGLSGYDRTLLALARTLVRESAGGYANGPLFWNEACGRLHRRRPGAPHLGNRARGARFAGRRTCSGGSGPMSSPIWTSHRGRHPRQPSGPQPLPFLPPVHPLRWPQSAPLHCAPAAAAGARPGPRGRRRSRGDRRAHGLRRPEPSVALDSPRPRRLPDATGRLSPSKSRNLQEKPGPPDPTSPHIWRSRRETE